MRLSQIKISGFKSFVDPTKIQFTANLTGIVGPNGCGKSNVIDAVRWVMGESSAKHLRGESMDDVIFSGSSTRKQVGQATVELLFDNTQGKAQGEYAKFNEISVKRLVSRDGQSKYFLNNTRCRRRDIADLFLGTGLGPRSYAIIEQGMITRIIDAKPEELRVYFEEAAGISKYKERRRETATRMKHTRENLERLTDVRDEVEKNIKRLDRQAKTADKYKILKNQSRRINAELLILQREQYKKQFDHVHSVIQALEIKMQSGVAELRKTEAELEQLRQQLIEANEQHNAVQGNFYRIGSDISSKEQLLTHQKQQLALNQQAIQKSNDSLANKRHALHDDKMALKNLELKNEHIKPNIKQAIKQQEYLENALTESEHAMLTWQKEWDEFNKQFHDVQQAAQLENKSIEHIEKQLLQLNNRLNSFKVELKTLDADVYNDEITSLEQHAEKAQLSINQHQKSIEAQQLTISQTRQWINDNDTILDAKRSEVQTLRGTFSSLQTLQDGILNQSSDSLNQWLKQHGLDSADRLTDVIKVSNGAEKAVEVVLNNLLGAYCTPSIHTYAASLKTIHDDNVILIDEKKSQHTSITVRKDWVLLTSQIQSEYDVTSLLGLVYLCDEDQLELRRQTLACYESLITPDGVWYGLNWMMQAGNDANNGVIQRDKEISQIKLQLNEITQSALEVKSKLDADKQQLNATEKSLSQKQIEANQYQKQLSSTQQSLVQKKERQQQVISRQQRIENDMSSIRSEADYLSADLKVITLKRNDNLLIINALNDKRDVISSKKDSLSSVLQKARIDQKENSNELHRLKIQEQANASEIRNTTQNLERMQREESQLKQRLTDAQLSIGEADQPIHELEQSLQNLLTEKNKQTEVLQQSQSLVSQLDGEQRYAEGQRVGHNSVIEQLRTETETERLQSQEIKVRIQTFDEQLQQTDFNVTDLQQELAENANISTHQHESEDLNRRINQLGQINLAAIEQFEEESERKKYLDEQDDDLNKSLLTLEQAIKKIDRETKDRFKELFDQVNERMKERFPKLFGGGEAHLELTENDLLTTGVVIMARPPGKRVNSLQLLSGGEKALTAVALIFAIFELNPSPFCMLDEVDAPLDDANVGRFCAMVKEMSEQVQFIFISHNKITMELADNLNGVTMHEPGISRLVTVNLEAASHLIETN